MQPVLTVSEMQEVDARAMATTPLDELVTRAGTAAARAALDLLGGAYGRRVVVVAGKGNNGADGRVAARVLSARGARVRVVTPGGTARIGAGGPAVDLGPGRAVARRAIRDRNPQTGRSRLRIPVTWSPPALSYGHGQSRSAVASATPASIGPFAPQARRQ